SRGEAARGGVMPSGQLGRVRCAGVPLALLVIGLACGRGVGPSEEEQRASALKCVADPSLGAAAATRCDCEAGTCGDGGLDGGGDGGGDGGPDGGPPPGGGEPGGGLDGGAGTGGGGGGGGGRGGGGRRGGGRGA